MSRYWIEQPCSYVHDGKAVVHTRVPAVAEIDDTVAAELGSAVRKVNENPDAPADPPVEAPVAPAEAPRRPRSKANEEKPEADSAPDGD